MTFLRFAAAAALLVTTPAMAQTPDPSQVTPVSAPAAAADPAATAAPTEAQATVHIPAGTVISLEITEALSSRTNQMGQTFALRLAEPIIINEEIAVPAGAIGGGEVIDAHRSGMGGRQGVLNISGRYIEVGGQQVRIRGMQVQTAGEDNTREAVNTAIIVGGAVGATIGLLIQGGEVEIPVGTRASARIATGFDAPWPPPVQVPPPEADAQAITSDTTAPAEGDTVASTEGEASQ